MKRALACFALLVCSAAAGEPNADRDFTPAAATEFGVGVVVPTLHQPAFSLGARLGVAHAVSWFKLALMGELAVQAAFNTGNSVDNYGYLLRVPFGISLEAAFPQDLDSQKGTTIVRRVALGFGYDFALAANCAAQCNYVQANAYPSFFARVGATYTTFSGNSVGFFVVPHLSVVKDSLGGSGVVMTLTFALGWSLF